MGGPPDRAGFRPGPRKLVAQRLRKSRTFGTTTSAPPRSRSGRGPAGARSESSPALPAVEELRADRAVAVAVEPERSAPAAAVRVAAGEDRGQLASTRCRRCAAWPGAGGLAERRGERLRARPRPTALNPGSNQRSSEPRWTRSCARRAGRRGPGRRSAACTRGRLSPGRRRASSNPAVAGVDLHEALDPLGVPAGDEPGGEPPRVADEAHRRPRARRAARAGPARAAPCRSRLPARRPAQAAEVGGDHAGPRRAAAITAARRTSARASRGARPAAALGRRPAATCVRRPPAITHSCVTPGSSGGRTPRASSPHARGRHHRLCRATGCARCSTARVPDEIRTPHPRFARDRWPERLGGRAVESRRHPRQAPVPALRGRPRRSTPTCG